MKTPLLAVFAAMFLTSGATRSSSAPEPAAPQIVAAQTNSPIVVAPAQALNVEPPKAVQTAPELPANMRVFVKSKAGRASLVVIHMGHLVTITQGDRRVFALNEASLALKDGSTIAWETSDRKTFDTVRGEVRWEGQPLTSTPSLSALSKPAVTDQISSGSHDCRSFDEWNGAISVLCRIDSYAAGAARVFGDKPQAGIDTIALDADGKKFFRAELRTGNDGADAVVFGYSEGGRGHVIRAEASMLPGETTPSLALLETERTQPMVFIRRHPHRFHHEFEPFF